MYILIFFYYICRYKKNYELKEKLVETKIEFLDVRRIPLLKIYFQLSAAKFKHLKRIQILMAWLDEEHVIKILNKTLKSIKETRSKWEVKIQKSNCQLLKVTYQTM